MRARGLCSADAAVCGAHMLFMSKLTKPLLYAGELLGMGAAFATKTVCALASKMPMCLQEPRAKQRAKHKV